MDGNVQPIWPSAERGRAYSRPHWFRGSTRECFREISPPVQPAHRMPSNSLLLFSFSVHVSCER